MKKRTFHIKLCKKDGEIIHQRDTQHAEMARRYAPHLLKLQCHVAKIIITVLQGNVHQIDLSAGCSFALHRLQGLMETAQTNELLGRHAYILAKYAQELPFAQTSYRSHLGSGYIPFRLVSRRNHFA